MWNEGDCLEEHAYHEASPPPFHSDRYSRTDFTMSIIGGVGTIPVRAEDARGVLTVENVDEQSQREAQ